MDAVPSFFPVDHEPYTHVGDEAGGTRTQEGSKEVGLVAGAKRTSKTRTLPTNQPMIGILVACTRGT